MTPQPIRRIVINWLCGAQDWNNYAHSVLKAFSNVAKGPHESMYLGYAAVVSDLIKELESKEIDSNPQG